MSSRKKPTTIHYWETTIITLYNTTKWKNSTCFKFNSPDLEISIAAHYCTCLFHLITEIIKLGKWKNLYNYIIKVLCDAFTTSNNIKSVDNIYIHSETALKGIDSDNKIPSLRHIMGIITFPLNIINDKIDIHTLLAMSFVLVYDNSDN